MPIVSLLKQDIKNWLQKSAHSELYASNLYKHLAAQMQRLGLFGAQEYFEKESKEELEHFEKLRDYANDMSDVLTIPAVEAFTTNVTSISQALNVAYKAEVDLLHQYEDFYEDAEEMEDCVTSQFVAQTFFPIQIKSVGEYGDLIARLEQSPSDVLLFDNYMKKLVK